MTAAPDLPARTEWSTRYVDALEQTLRSLVALGDSLSPADWERSTDCPGWSVRDQFSHVVGVESELLGEPPPDHVAPEAAHLRDDVGRRLERAVNYRRARPGPEVLAELREVALRRVEALRAEPPAAEEVLASPLGGTVPAERLLPLRVFDTWVHEQDVRRAVGRPGNLTGPAAEISRAQIVRSLPRVVAKVAGAPPGSAVLLEVTGPGACTAGVVVGPDGRGTLADVAPDAATVRLGMDGETFLRLSAGRCVPAHVEVDASGDLALAARILDALAITP